MAGDGADGLYYHDGIGTYTNANQEAEDNSYRYSGGDYQVTDKAISEGYLRISSANFSETDSVINLYCEDEKGYIGLTCSETETHYYTTAYDETEHYHTYEEALEQAVLDGYLTKDHVKNFICFGPGAENSTCPEENLYRIIGVFNNQVKLIKYDYADTTLLGTDGDYQGTSESFISGRPQNNTLYRYYWNYSSGSSSTNDWNQSRLNTINLNTNYWNYLTTTWQEKIANTTWKVGGNTYDAIRTVTAKVAFNNEIESPAEATTYQDEIGLMYVSDYMYAADPSGWLNIGYEFGAKNDYQAIKGKNWMYMGAAEWTITPRYEDDDTVFDIVTTGSITRSTVVDISNVRPVLYLNSDVQITGNNTGTKDNPYRLVI